ncbi:hypothetical protein GCM10011504_25560 [Siccirubricoccus deserti]|uniref:Uncharacterized protein n=1 Tax=Siccirubricoccus deserti TaxID=2013562 RepID=A0A9X0R0K2_9PROT|nr:hypothetical protein [Siccirubricoccus deserti]GGC45985.1 hypothetical protein GCM10011504_25560 [Siccirubricoccus deserti]
MGESALSQAKDREARAALAAGSGRCAEFVSGETAAAGWQMLDCRTWTNMARARPDAQLALAWP